MHYEHTVCEIEKNITHHVEYVVREWGIENYRWDVHPSLAPRCGINLTHVNHLNHKLYTKLTYTQIYYLLIGRYCTVEMSILWRPALTDQNT